jgi:starvation-inducible DNA-binding protein
VARATALERYPADITEGLAHVDALATAVATFGRNVRKAIDTTDEQGDAVTADLFTEIAGDVDKYLWLLEAHLQAKR